MSALALFTCLLIISCSPSSYAVFSYSPDNQGVGARSYVLKLGYFKSKTYFYNNHVATFNLAKLHWVCVHPSPGPSEYDTRHVAGLKTLYMNSRSIKALVNDNNAVQGSRISKLVLFQNLVYSEQFDIVCVSETWLHEGILDNEILQGYTTVCIEMTA